MQRWIAVVAAGVLALAAGCSGSGQDDPTTAPPTSSAAPTTQTPTAEPTTESPSPTPEETAPPEPTEEEVLTAEAIAALEEYVALSNEVANDHYRDWQRLTKWWGTPEIVDSLAASYQEDFEAGSYTEGSSEIVDVSIVEFVADPTSSGHERVSLEYCLDLTDVRRFSAGGNEEDDANSLERVPFAVTLQRMGQGANWGFVQRAASPEGMC